MQQGPRSATEVLDGLLPGLQSDRAGAAGARFAKSPMTNTPVSPSQRPLRILEIGPHELFAQAVPEQTEFYWTGNKRRGCALGPLHTIRLLKRLRRREFDLVVIHVGQYSPWHPRSILTTLRDWHVMSPLGLFANFAWRLMHLFHKVPIAVVDLGDSFLIGGHNFRLLDACKLYFKRELPSDNWLAFSGRWYPNFPGRRYRSIERHRRRAAKLRPISYGCFPFPEPIEPREKTADIAFAGSVENNSSIRAAGLSELLALRQQGYVVDIAEAPLPRADFLRRIAAARLVWSPAGLGWDCSRHYEAAMVGSVPLINHPSITRERPFEDGVHCVLYAAEPGGLTQAVRAALADKPKLQRMGEAARAHALRHHTDRARCDHIAATVLGRHLDGAPAETAIP
jgi:hypothetical protein